MGVCDGGSFSQLSCGPQEVCAPVRPSEAACVNRICWVDRGGADGAFCLDEATAASCSGGALTTAPCPNGQRCTQSGDAARCQAGGAPDADAGPTADADGPSDAVAGDPSVTVSGISRQTSLRTRRADQGCRGGGSGSPGVPTTLLVVVLVLLRRLSGQGAARPR